MLLPLKIVFFAMQIHYPVAKLASFVAGYSAPALLSPQLHECV